MKTIFFILLTLLAVGSAQASTSSTQQAVATNQGIGQAVIEPLPYACFAASRNKPCETYTLVITTDHGIVTIPNFNSRQNCTTAASQVKARRGAVSTDAYCVGVINGR